ncbi:MAG: hypothetical protein ACT4QA_23750 [Panacagrimonas sp.]
MSHRLALGKPDQLPEVGVMQRAIWRATWAVCWPTTFANRSFRLRRCATSRGSDGWPLLGQTLEFLNDPIACCRRLHGAYGPVSRGSTLFERRVNLMSAEANEFVLLDRDRLFSTRRGGEPAIGQMLRRGLLRVGEDHRYRRRLIPVMRCATKVRTGNSTAPCRRSSRKHPPSRRRRPTASAAFFNGSARPNSPGPRRIRIVDTQGQTYADTSSWYWAAVPGRSIGPSRVVTRVERREI